MRGLTFVVLVFAGLVQAQPATLDYHATVLGTLGGAQSEAWAINNACQVVGWASTASDNYHAFLWQLGVMTDLGTLGGDISLATDVNARGQIVGWSSTSTQAEHPFLWENGVMTDLGSLGGTYSFAAALNEQRQVVGRSQTATGEFRAFLWENGVMTDLGTLGGDYSEANDINERGQVVGASTTSNGESHACLWENGLITDLGMLDGLPSGARAVNSRSQVVGQASDVAFIVQGGVMSPLSPAGTFTEALDINDRSQTVGWETFGSDSLAVLWERDGSIHELLCPAEIGDGCRSGAEGIANSGRVVGWSGAGGLSPQRATLWDLASTGRSCSN